MAWFSFGASKSPSIEEQYKTVVSDIESVENDIFNIDSELDNIDYVKDNLILNNYGLHTQNTELSNLTHNITIAKVKLEELKELKLELFYQLPDNEDI